LIELNKQDTSKEALLNNYAEYRSWDELKKGQYTEEEKRKWCLYTYV
jgi:hypothetical protein